MSVPSSPGQAAQRTAGRSIDFYFGAGLIGPVACLLVLWGAITGVVLSGTLGKLHWLESAAPSQRALIGSAVIAGVGLAVLVAAIIMMGRLARRLSREADRLAATARYLADERLPQIVEAMRDGEQITADTTMPLPEASVSEIAAAVAAVARLHHSAVAAATAEAGLRTGFREILVSLGRRNQSLLHRQLRIIDILEQQASSPAALAELFTPRPPHHPDAPPRGEPDHLVRRGVRARLERARAGHRRHARRRGGGRGLHSGHRHL